MEGLLLRFDAPLMSFGGVKVDHHNITDRFPGLSSFAGLIANALGWRHADGERLNQLQDRLVIASRWDLEPQVVVDYQTVDLGQPKMKEKGWTTRGEPEHREGGPAAKFGIHQRYRHYLANGVLTAVLALKDSEVPDLDLIEYALRFPARPLFLGRKTCLPSRPILLGRTQGENILTMLRAAPRSKRSAHLAGQTMSARWPAGLTDERPEQIKPVYDCRDWLNQWHAGSRLVAEGPIQEVPPCT